MTTDNAARSLLERLEEQIGSVFGELKARPELLPIALAGMEHYLTVITDPALADIISILRVRPDLIAPLHKVLEVGLNPAQPG